MSTELTLTQRAAVPFDKTAEELRTLAAASSSITAITNAAGRQQAVGDLVRRAVAARHQRRVPLLKLHVGRAQRVDLKIPIGIHEYPVGQRRPGVDRFYGGFP